MDNELLGKKIAEIFPRAAFVIDDKRGNIRVHFSRIDEDYFIPSKWMFCNALNLSEKIVRVSMKKFQDPLFDNSPSKVFIIKNGVYLE